MLHLAAFWYYMVKDVPRLKRVMAAINQIQVPHPWHYLGDATMMFTQAIQITM